MPEPGMSRPGWSPRRGTVVEFDEHRGLGTVEEHVAHGSGQNGGRCYPFHCTAITGSRTIEVGLPVVFSVSPGHLGRDEARGVTTLEDTAS
ncbi:MAG: hypothetical protein M5U31_11900 [Acidimicrobiia bacterium]|nr:hypothetical protein [Acidimicrobiia bacterium]